MSGTPSSLDEARFSSAFFRAAGRELIHALDAEVDVVYAVDVDFRLQFVNPAWRRFALANGGASCLETYVIGVSTRPAIPPVLSSFYESAFASVLIDGAVFDHLYECPSPTQQRSFRMRVVRLGEGPFVVVSNQLVIEIEDDDAGSANPDTYVDAAGMVVQCAHCRRCRRVGSEVWDWVPAFVAERSEDVSHGLCPSCFAHHYAQ